MSLLILLHKAYHCCLAISLFLLNKYCSFPIENIRRLMLPEVSQYSMYNSHTPSSVLHKPDGVISGKATIQFETKLCVSINTTVMICTIR